MRQRPVACSQTWSSAPQSVRVAQAAASAAQRPVDVSQKPGAHSSSRWQRGRQVRASASQYSSASHVTAVQVHCGVGPV